MDYIGWSYSSINTLKMNFALTGLSVIGDLHKMSLVLVLAFHFCLDQINKLLHAGHNKSSFDEVAILNSVCVKVLWWSFFYFLFFFFCVWLGRIFCGLVLVIFHYSYIKRTCNVYDLLQNGHLFLNLFPSSWASSSF